MAEKRIYYGDGTVSRGDGPEWWADAPDDGVQVVVEMRPGPWRSYEGDDGTVIVKDRTLWTGREPPEEYDPFGWGMKRGSLIPDDEYWALWRRACTD